MSALRNLFTPMLAATLLACGDADVPVTPLGDPPRRPVAGCEAFDPTPCNVEASACQERLLGLAACLRGQPAGALPPISVMTEQQYADYLNELYAKQEPQPNPDHYERALTMLRLVEPGAFTPEKMVAERVAFIWGVYRWHTKDIVLVDHGDAFNDESASIVLVHELVHALQDRDRDLEEFEDTYGASYDAYLATDAVVEGEARMHETRYAASALGVDPSTLDWGELFENAIARDEAWLRDQPSPYTATWQIFPYEWGARYMHFTWEHGGLDAVRARFATPPRTSHTLMTSVDDAVDTEVGSAVPKAPDAPAEWTPFADTVLGAWGVRLALEAAGEADAAEALAEQWRGDGLWVYSGTSDSGTTAFVWRIDFAESSSAQTVAARLSASLGTAGGSEVHAQGSRVVVAGTYGPGSLAWAFAE